MTSDREKETRENHPPLAFYVGVTAPSEITIRDVWVSDAFHNAIKGDKGEEQYMYEWMDNRNRADHLTLKEVSANARAEAWVLRKTGFRLTVIMDYAKQLQREWGGKSHAPFPIYTPRHGKGLVKIRESTRSR